MTLEHALLALFLFLPAGVSNMTPIFASKLPYLRRWNTPLDFGKSYRGKRVLGNNKTWRGLVCGVVAGSLTGAAMSLAADPDGLVSYTAMSAAMAAGALIGDAVESFFKRQRNIPAGKAWFPFDQTDYIIGGLLFLAPFGVLTAWFVGWVLVLYFGLHLIASYTGYLLGLKDQPI